MIKAVRHTGIVVRNLDESVKFYRALGFVEDNRDIEEGVFYWYSGRLAKCQIRMGEIKSAWWIFIGVIAISFSSRAEEYSKAKVESIGLLSFSI